MLVKRTTRYEENNNFVNNIDPRLKIISFFMFTITIFLQIGFYTNFIILGISIFTMFFARANIVNVLRNFKITLFIIPILFLINFFVITPPMDAFLYTIAYWAKIYSIINFGTCLIISTSQNDLSFGISWLLTPLQFIGISKNDIGLIISIALRFFPILINEISNILVIESSRKLNANSLNIVMKIKAIFFMFLPLMIRTLKKADDVSKVLELKTYESEQKMTKYKINKLKINDFILFLYVSGIETFLILTIIF